MERYVNYVLPSFWEAGMVRVVVGEVVALISLGLFLATVAVWAQVLCDLAELSKASQDRLQRLKRREIQLGSNPGHVNVN
jgi:hypothetical protein